MLERLYLWFKRDLFCSGSFFCCSGGLSGLFCGGSGLRCGLGFSSGLSGCSLGFLLANLLSLSLVLFLFFLKCFLRGGFFAFTLFVAYSLEFSVFFCFPGVPAALEFSLVEGAFLDTALEVLHQHHAFAAKDVAHGVGGLCANVHPIQSALEI